MIQSFIVKYIPYSTLTKSPSAISTMEDATIQKMEIMVISRQETIENAAIQNAPSSRSSKKEEEEDYTTTTQDYAKDYDYTEDSDDDADDDDSLDNPKQVQYHDGATSLFLAIEQTDWRQALQVVEQEPAQTKTWVCSVGTVETTFNWALWRRLPIHEACRRQAPAWLISALLVAHPDSSRAVTQFGATPLHLAVECGAPPEVVNLLVTAHWLGIKAQDQSGRTPLEILNDSELLDQEDQKVVLDSLTRSQTTYQEICKEHETEIAIMQQQHTEGLVAIRQHHHQDLQVEQEEQDRLLKEVERLNELLATTNQTNDRQQQNVDAFGTIEAEWRRKNKHLKQQVVNLGASNQQEKDRVGSLQQVIELKDHEISNLELRIRNLSGDLQAIDVHQQDTMDAHVRDTELRIHQMVASFVTLQSGMESQAQRTRGLLKERGIALSTKQQPNEAVAEEKKESLDDSEGGHGGASMDDEFAMLSAAEAASSALQLD